MYDETRLACLAFLNSSAACFVSLFFFSAWVTRSSCRVLHNHHVSLPFSLSASGCLICTGQKTTNDHTTKLALRLDLARSGLVRVR